jgi:hypothetical protein
MSENTDQVQNFLKWLSRIVSIGMFPSIAFTIIETASATVSSPDLGESFLVLFDRFLPEHVFSVSRCCPLPLARADWKVDISMLCKSRRERMGSLVAGWFLWMLGLFLLDLAVVFLLLPVGPVSTCSWAKRWHKEYENCLGEKLQAVFCVSSHPIYVYNICIYVYI